MTRDYTMRRERKGQYSPTILNEGEMPKPKRLKALCRLANKLHKELLDAKEPTKTIALKDPRTVQTYYETLALYKITLTQVEDMVKFLEEALF